MHRVMHLGGIGHYRLISYPLICHAVVQHAASFARSTRLSGRALQTKRGKADNPTCSVTHPLFIDTLYIRTMALVVTLCFLKG
jgi:hypothetical protein